MPSPIDYMDPNFVEQNNIYLPEAQDPHRYSFSNNLMPRNEHNQDQIAVVDMMGDGTGIQHDGNPSGEPFVGDTFHNPPTIIPGGQPATPNSQAHTMLEAPQEAPNQPITTQKDPSDNRFKSRTMSSTGKIKPQLQSVRELGGEDNEATIEDEDLGE